MTRTLERYDEAGQPIFAPECGELKNLWKFMEDSNAFNSWNEKNSVNTTNFDYNEFFKRLYLSRAELDILGSVLQLFLNSGSNEEIKLELVKRELQENKPISSMSEVDLCGDARILAIKASHLTALEQDVLGYAKQLRKNRNEESVVLLNILMRGVELYRWKLLRISSPDHIQLSLDYQEANPIIAIDYSPALLFKDSESHSEQYNYKQSHQISGDNLALVLRDNRGQISLLLQSKRRILHGSVIISLKNIDTNTAIQFTLFSSNTFIRNINYSSANSLEQWDNVLSEARNRIICSNIMTLLFHEANTDSCVNTFFSPDKHLKLILESNQELSFTVGSCDDQIVSSLETDSTLKDLYDVLVSQYLNSSGKSVGWLNIKQIFSNLNSNIMI